MDVYGLRRARALIAAERKELAAIHPRSQDPFVRGQREALMRMDEKIEAEMRRLLPTRDDAISST